jgi:phosphopentomutase
MVAETAAWVGKLEAGFVFANASGLDSTYAHRNDPAGWSAALSELDEALAGLLDALADDDVLIVTGDHGNDPTTPSTDHSREYVPVLACTRAAWRRGSEGRDLGTRDTFADVAATVCELLLGTVAGLPGTSFAPHLR